MGREGLRRCAVLELVLIRWTIFRKEGLGVALGEIQAPGYRFFA